MTRRIKDFLLCGIVAFILFEVESKPNHEESKLRGNDALQNSRSLEPRGLIGDLIHNIRPGTSVQVLVPQQQQGLNIRPPNIYPVDNGIAQLSPIFQIPSNFNSPTQTVMSHNKPFLGGILSNIIHSKEYQTVQTAPINTGYNTAWVDYAMQKCARVDSSQLTAILPTSANGLRAPKMYFFQNETSAAVPWFKAQEECTKKGMTLVTVNDAAENRVLQEKLRTIMAGVTPPSTTAGFWIGLNNLNIGNTPTWVGDGSSTFVDWLPGDPPTVAPLKWCASYNSATSPDNIHFQSRQCLDAAADIPLRYICEVSDDCTALFMSRFPTQHQHHHHHNINPGK